MSEDITVREAAALLQGWDRILILTHQYPDGDTLGSGFALCRGLQLLGKTARVECSDRIPEKYDYLFEDYQQPEFEPHVICAVDVADPRLLGDKLSVYADRVELCIDHHGSNTGYARRRRLDAGSAATAELILELLREWGVRPDRMIAECLYTGIATDTGCFKYSNTTSATHRAAAELMDIGIRAELINRTMFDVKSRPRVELERLALDSMRFYFGGRCAVMFITNEMVKKAAAGENDMEGLAPIPRQIEGVWVGVTLREKADGTYKVSVRTGTHADASAICAVLGGGGHVRAAGCTLEGSDEQAAAQMLEAIRRTVPGIA